MLAFVIHLSAQIFVFDVCYYVCWLQLLLLLLLLLLLCVCVCFWSVGLLASPLDQGMLRGGIAPHWRDFQGGPDGPKRPKPRIREA